MTERQPDGSGDEIQVNAAVLDVDYVNRGENSIIRMSVKAADGSFHELFDPNYRPYFYFVPSGSTDISGAFVQDGDKVIRPLSIEKTPKTLLGKPEAASKVTVSNASYVPKLSEAMRHLGDAYENDIPFAKRYVIDKSITPLVLHKIRAKRENGRLELISIEKGDGSNIIPLDVMCFDIEVYSPSGNMPKANKDPIIMISYSFKGREKKSGVITFKKIDLPFVESMPDEKSMLTRFMAILDELQPDILTGYNSSGFDVKYLIERCNILSMKFSMSRFEGETKLERHGLVDRVKIAGRVHVDMYTVIKFISIVGAAESILKLNSKTLKNVYEAISGDQKKVMVDKPNIWKMWDGGRGELEALATYNLDDSFALEKVYETFIPIMTELARLTYDPLTDVCVSTTGQLVEFMMMHSSCHNNELIPNKPDDNESRERLRNPIEGAYVKTPEPGIYDNLAMFDFRGLYPSIIISYNIDPSTVIRNDAKEYYESPDGTRFDKARKGIMPALLKMLMDQRSAVKKAYKKNPGDIMLGSRSMALKIVSNSFYGYLGYARSRWYSRACAASVTAFGRQYINDVMDQAAEQGMKVIYGDTDSLVLLMGDKTKEDAINFMKMYNAKLPEPMELELEDFYSRGVFVGKKMQDKGDTTGAKKKYALISESGRIKIRGFELVRRDWSRIARDTQRMVLETILKEGDPAKASEIVKEAIRKLRAGEVPLSEVVISTQLRKSIEGYDVKSPEVSAAKKAVSSGFKTKEEVENNIIGYIITKHGSTISDKAEVEGMAKDYDPEYYISHQVVPSTMKILKELGFSEEELKGLGTQKKLGG